MIDVQDVVLNVREELRVQMFKLRVWVDLSGKVTLSTPQYPYTRWAYVCSAEEFLDRGAEFVNQRVKEALEELEKRVDNRE